MSDGSVLARRRAYEAEVVALADVARSMLADGDDVETVARALVGRRNAIKAKYRALDDPAAAVWMEARNRARYGDPLGPTPDRLFLKYGSWEAVIAACARHARTG